MEVFHKDEYGIIFHGNATELHEHIAEDSVDWILTDPPYPKEYLYCWEYLPKLAEHSLKLGGSIFTLGGEYYLDQIMMYFYHSPLTWHYPIGYLVGAQHATIFPRKVFAALKIILWYVKGTYTNSYWYTNVICNTSSYKYEKSRLHVWEQPEDFCQDIIMRLTTKNQILMDPYAGSGTVPVVAKKFGLKYIACDIDLDNCETMKARLLATQPLFVQRSLAGYLKSGHLISLLI